MKICFMCGKEKINEEIISTDSFLLEEYQVDYHRYYCKDCVGDKEICCCCGQPNEDGIWCGECAECN